MQALEKQPVGLLFIKQPGPKKMPIAGGDEKWGLDYSRATGIDILNQIIANLLGTIMPYQMEFDNSDEIYQCKGSPLALLREGDVKGRAAAGEAFGADGSAVALDDFFANGEAHAGSTHPAGFAIDTDERFETATCSSLIKDLQNKRGWKRENFLCIHGF